MDILDIINSVPDQALIFLLIGIIFIVIAIFLGRNDKMIRENGIEADGIIYSLGQSENTPEGITVRFLTKEKLWITERVKSDFISYTGQYKPGEPIKVKYNPDNPKDFILVSKQPQKIFRVCIAIVGCLLVIAGVYQCYR